MPRLIFFDKGVFEEEYKGYTGPEDFNEYRTYVISDTLGTGEWEIVSENEQSLAISVFVENTSDLEGK